MDDLQMLRDLGRDLEHEPPASLVRQRERMYGRRTGRPSRPKSWLVLGVAAAVTASALLVPRLLFHNETGHLNVLDDPGTVEGTKPDQDVNILLLGSDRRAGRNTEKEAARSDTIIVAHVPADGRGVKVVSIPRDTLVDVPDCRDRDGRTVPGGRSVISRAFTTGGAECARRTVENLAGITLDHTVVFGFDAFKRAVDAVGGVEVDVKVDMEDPKAKLSLSRGLQTLRGEQALAYARARYNLGDGSDLGRIARQQELMTAILKKVKPQLGDLAKISKLVDAVAPLLSADEKLTSDVVLRIISTFARSDNRTVAFATAPWEPAPDDPNRLVLKQPDAERLWQSLR
ncbi:LCP family protein [Actinocorallia populi]|uniref:LCP family protein n=1 Tax=Actinocorallia populi TaxID=2079200 RepID=UPI0013004C8C|nr:LCP family protein [Actinocorallia populi]